MSGRPSVPCLGLDFAFAPGDKIGVLQAASTLRALGIAHARVEGDADAIAALGAVCRVVPVFRYGHGDLQALLDAVGPAVDAVEISVAEPLPTDIGGIVAAASLVRRAGKLAVLGVSARQAGELRLHDVLAGFVAVAVRVDCGDDVRLDFAGMPVWGVISASAEDEAAQAHRFVRALGAGAERVYWRGLEDEEGQQTLLARLLEDGADGVAAVLANPAPAILKQRPVLVTGGAGFIGANLADRLAQEGHSVLVYDALTRAGVERNLAWLKHRHPGRIAVAIADIRDEAALTEAARHASAVFHLAAQVAVTTSLVRPVRDFDINLRGTLTVLEALRRHNPEAPLLFASTNKVYGALADIALVRRGDHYVPEDAALRGRGIDEARPLCFHTPYGCSKGAADQYVLDYAHSFGLRASVLRMSCIYGERQFGTEDQGWLAHFLLRALAGDTLTIYGDGRQVRDVLHIDDAVDAYMAAWRNIDVIAGRAFNLGGGPANAISLLQLVDHIGGIIGRPVNVSFEDWRAGDQRYFVADARAVRDTLNLPAPLGWRDGVARLATHFGARAHAVKMTEIAL